MSQFEGSGSVFHEQKTYYFEKSYISVKKDRLLKYYKCSDDNCKGRLKVTFKNTQPPILIDIEVTREHCCGIEYPISTDESFLRKQQLLIELEEWAEEQEPTIHQLRMRSIMLQRERCITPEIIYESELERIIRNVQSETRVKDILESLDPLKIQFDHQAYIRKISKGDVELVIFGLNKFIEIGRTSQLLFIDGTFKCVPIQFKGGQMLNFTVLEESTNMYIPVLHVLMRNRTEKSYTGVFAQCMEYINFGSMQFCSTDFERALMEIAETFVGKNKVSGCLFHYKQALRRKFVSIYQNPSPIQKIYLKVYYNLPFCDENLFVAINEFFLKYCPEITEFAIYYNNTWAKRYNKIKKFSVPFELYTNNALESYHSVISKKVPTHGSIYNLINTMGQIDVMLLTKNIQLKLENKKIKRYYKQASTVCVK